jgi:hypothetical protein
MKKGILSILMITRFIFLALALFSVVFLTKYFVVQNLESNRLEMEVFYNRMIYSPNALAYVDNVTGRAYPGVIDFDKFNSENLDKTLNYTYKRTLAAKLTLGEFTPVYYNKEWYDRFSPLKRMRGLSGVLTLEKSLPVVYEDNDKLYPAILKVEILKQKT